MLIVALGTCPSLVATSCLHKAVELDNDTKGMAEIVCALMQAFANGGVAAPLSRQNLSLRGLRVHA